MKKYLKAVSIMAALVTAPVAAQDAKPVDASAAAPMMKVDTPTFVKLVTSSDMFEIESSKLAEQKSAASDIKSFATQMVADHTKASKELNAALEKDGAAKPSEAALAPKHAAMLKLLEGADGAKFDMLYIDMQAGAHMEAVSLFQTFAKSGDDEKVKAFAEATLPKLQGHKQHVAELVAKH